LDREQDHRAVPSPQSVDDVSPNPKPNATTTAAKKTKKKRARKKGKTTVKKTADAARSSTSYTFTSPELQNAISREIGDEHDIVVSTHKTPLLRGDMRRLNLETNTDSDKYLNDQLVNLWFTMLESRAGREDNHTDLFMNSYLHAKLIHGEKLSQLKKWFDKKKKKSSAVTRIFIPINLNLHWWLVVVDMQKRILRYYNSLEDNNSANQAAKLSPLLDEAFPQLKSRGDWSVVNGRSPQQPNLYDCGVCVCQMADVLAQNAAAPQEFSEKNMQDYRQYMAIHLLNGPNSLPAST